MDKNTTPLTTSEPASKTVSDNAARLQPSEKTITLLKSLARNLHTEPRLPQGLQKLILG